MLGQRLKQARTEAGLSQRQLCGETITRNMLSQIESGKARPSMQTLAYLAQALGKPVSWFLEETPEPPPADPTPGEVRQCYQTGQYQRCLELLENYREDTPELQLVRVLSRLALAKEAVTEGKFHYARSLLEEISHAGGGLYYTPELERERLLLLYRCNPERAGELAAKLPADDREIFLRAQSCLAAGSFEACTVLLNAAHKQDAHWHYMYGQAVMGQRQYRKAAEHFILAEAAYPIPCAKALETCYRELEDYKMAYHYACKQR